MTSGKDLVRVISAHSVTPIIAMVCVTVLAFKGAISGTDAMLVILGCAGFNTTAAAGVSGMVTGSVATQQATTPTEPPSKAA